LDIFTFAKSAQAMWRQERLAAEEASLAIVTGGHGLHGRDEGSDRAPIDGAGSSAAEERYE
jgi:hypothetical protein